MAEVYFGARVPVSTLNGDWANVSQWYSTIGEDATKNDAAIPGTPLNRVANSATDVVYMMQQAQSGVGTYSGDISAGQCSDPTAVWTGNFIPGGTHAFFRGTYTGNISTPNGGSISINGGNFSNATFLPGSWGYTIAESRASGDTTSLTPYALTLPTNFSITSNGQVNISRQMNWIYPIYFVPGGRRYLIISRGAMSFEMPTISIDISTSAINANEYDIYGGGLLSYVTFNANAAINLNTVLTNTNPLILGSNTDPVDFNFTNIGPQREITIYTSIRKANNGSFIFNFIGVQFPTTYDKLNIIECPLLSGPASINVSGGSNATWQPTYNLPMNNTSEGTKYKLVNNTLPFPYSFGQNGTIYNPTVNIAVTKNIGAVLE